MFVCKKLMKDKAQNFLYSTEVRCFALFIMRKFLPEKDVYVNKNSRNFHHYLNFCEKYIFAF